MARDRGQRGRIFDVVLSQMIVALLASLLILTTVLPNARKASRAERSADRLELEVEVLARRVSDLRREVVALHSDPQHIERVLRRKLKRVSPHRYQPQVLADAPAVSEGVAGTSNAATPYPFSEGQRN